LSIDRLGPTWQAIIGHGPAIIEDVRDETPVATGLREAVGDAFENATLGIHSWMGVPLMLQDRIVGLLALTHVEKAYFTDHHYELVQAIANQAAVAIENAKL